MRVLAGFLVPAVKEIDEGARSGIGPAHPAGKTRIPRVNRLIFLSRTDRLGAEVVHAFVRPALSPYRFARGCCLGQLLKIDRFSHSSFLSSRKGLLFFFARLWLNPAPCGLAQ